MVRACRSGEEFGGDLRDIRVIRVIRVIRLLYWYFRAMAPYHIALKTRRADLGGSYQG